MFWVYASVDPEQDTTSYQVERTDGATEEHGTYTQDNINYEYEVVRVQDGTLYSKLYAINEDGTKTLQESLVVENDGESIYVNGEFAANVKHIVGESDDMTGYTLYPPDYSNGEAKGLNPLTSTTFTIANVLLSSLNLVPVYINLGVQGFILVASKIIDKNLDRVWFFEKSQFETFPTNVPPGYAGAITRIDYEVDYYSSAVMTGTNQLGNKIVDVYYGMP